LFVIQGDRHNGSERVSDELQPYSIVVATLYAVTDAREKPGAIIFRMQLNDPIFR
jgi:hypothetical protein